VFLSDCCEHVILKPFGCKPLAEVLSDQLAAVAHVRQYPNTAILLYGEHYPVFTVGRAFKAAYADNLMGIPVEKVSRGGQLTYHGPGQLVVYPIVALSQVSGVPALLQKLERWIGQALDELGLPTLYPPPCGTPERPATGVWVKPALLFDKGNTLTEDAANPGTGPQKIASIGLALKHWVSYHGVALNVCNSLLPYQAIQPCGYTPQTMTSLHAHWLACYPDRLPPHWGQLLQALALETP
jgi:lipoyl(octanoyl) transferase